MFLLIPKVFGIQGFSEARALDFLRTKLQVAQILNFIFFIYYSENMAVTDSSRRTKKRKEPTEDTPIEAPVESGNLEMLSDEEDGKDAISDDGHVDEFPEIDTGSDSEDEEFEGADDEDDGDSDEGDEEDAEDAEEDSDFDSDDSELHIFPKAKTITSEITGHPKRVYPEIEPNYDSDSSTEDVGSLLSPNILSTSTTSIGS